MTLRPIDELPGYRRRFLTTAGPGWTRADLEDDIHHMHVTLRHADGIVTAVEPVMERWPWASCPGAGEVLQETFVGQPLEALARRGDKAANCTHLYDLAVLAAAHAADTAPMLYDVLVSDPIDGRTHAELRRNGETLMVWELGPRREFVAPADLAGSSLHDMRGWLAGLDPELQEAARVLRWGAMVSHSRRMPIEDQWAAGRTAPRCYTFQRDLASPSGDRVGEILDFSAGTHAPLERRVAEARGEGRGQAAR